MSSTGDFLRTAAMVIEKHGWVQGKFGSELCGFCILGAMLHTCDVTNITRAQMFLDTITGLYGVAHWNDQPGRTKEEVLALLTQAAKVADDHGTARSLGG
jgi:hypothetical protein